MPDQGYSDTVEKIERLPDDIESKRRPMPKLVPNEDVLKQRFPLGEWSIDNLEDLLDMTDRGIQQILRMVSSDQLVIALYPCSDVLKQYVISNMSRRAGEFLEDDLFKAHPSSSEINEAKTELIRISTEQLSLLEQEEWDRLMLILPEVPLPDEPDLNLLLSLEAKATKAWMVNVSMYVLVHAMALDDDWYPLWENKVEPQISKKELELLAKDINYLTPQFSWQLEISRLLISYYGQPEKKSR